MKKLLPFFSLLSLLILWGCPNEPQEEDVLTPVKTEYTIGAEGGEISISFNTNLVYSVNKDADWLTIVTKATKAVELKTVVVKAAANPSTEPRQAKVTVSGGKLTAEITVKQSGVDVQIDIDKASCTVPAAGGDFTVTVGSTVEYSVSVSDSWITHNGGKNGTESFTVAANDTGSERTGTVTFSCGNLMKTVTVTQPAIEIPEEDVLENGGKSAYAIPYAGGSFTVTVRSNVDYIVDCGADWIHQAITKTVTEQSVTFMVDANDGDARQAVVSFTFGSELTFSVNVSQNAYIPPTTDEPYLEIDASDRTVDEYGGEISFPVHANYEYTVDCDADWVEIRQTGETFVCFVQPNPETIERSTMMLFSSEGIVVYFTIYQLAQGSNLDPFDVGSNLSVNGQANCYIVPKAGDYTFDASVMGNGPQGYIWEDEAAVEQNLWPWSKVEVAFANYGAEKPSRAEVLWDDNNVITNVSIDDNMIVSFTATGNKGNAVIVVYNKTELLWSWHIWCTDSPARIRHDVLDGSRVVMLDRNLGATSANPADGEKTFGYWYQWGRKDPLKLYYGVAGYMWEGDQSVAYSVKHPNVIFRMVGKTNEWFNGSVKTITADMWGNPYALHNGTEHLYRAQVNELRKTIYDPCPPGYMVPPEWAWETMNMDNCTISDMGLSFQEDNGVSFYPFAGFGDAGDMYGGDNGWYGYPGYTPNSDGSKWHHNVRNVMACWSSGCANSFERTGDVNYQDVYMFYYMQNEELSGNTVMVNENSRAYFYTQYSHIRHRCCSVRCMKIQ